MKRIDFNAKRKVLHEQILSAIKNLLKEYDVNELDFPMNGKVKPRVLRGLKLASVFEEIQVTKLTMRNNILMYKGCGVSGDKVLDDEDDEWINLERDTVCTCLGNLYDVVFDTLVH